MAEVYREVHEVSTANGDESVTPTTKRADSEYGMALAARIIYFVGGILVALLALRFLLALLGANPGNGFANFIYTISHPFASPFFSLFSYDQTLGKSKLEVGTLVAIVVYGVVTAILARLVTLGSRRPQ